MSELGINRRGVCWKNNRKPSVDDDYAAICGPRLALELAAVVPRASKVLRASGFAEPVNGATGGHGDERRRSEDECEEKVDHGGSEKTEAGEEGQTGEGGGGWR